MAEKTIVGEEYIIADVTLVYRTLQKYQHVLICIDKEWPVLPPPLFKTYKVALKNFVMEM